MGSLHRPFGTLRDQMLIPFKYVRVITILRILYFSDTIGKYRMCINKADFTDYRYEGEMQLGWVYCAPNQIGKCRMYINIADFSDHRSQLWRNTLCVTMCEVAVLQGEGANYESSTANWDERFVYTVHRCIWDSHNCKLLFFEWNVCERLYSTDIPCCGYQKLIWHRRSLWFYAKYVVCFQAHYPHPPFFPKYSSWRECVHYWTGNHSWSLVACKYISR